MPRAQPGQRFGGRQKGSKNIITADLKAQIIEAMSTAQPGGAVAWLKWLALNNSGAFAGLVGKIIPSTLEHTGKDGGPIETADMSARELIESRIGSLAERIGSSEGSKRLN